MTRLAFFGTSEFAASLLERLSGSQFRPELVVCTPDAPAGRGQKPRSPAVKTAAERLGIPAIQPERLSPAPGPLADSPWDMFVVAAYGKILPADLLRIPTFGALNVHPSLLPRWRGPSPIQYAILSGDQETGVTIMLMDERVDHGPVIRNSKFKIQNLKVAAPELARQLAEMGAELLLDTIPGWMAGAITPEAQDESRVTYSRLLKREDGRIDWSKPAEETARMVRAFPPWPGAYAFWQRGADALRLSIEMTEGQKTKVEGRAAGIVFEQDGEMGIQAGNGTLLVQRLKPEGGRSMSGREFLRGHRGIIGAILY